MMAKILVVLATLCLAFRFLASFCFSSSPIKALKSLVLPEGQLQQCPHQALESAPPHWRARRCDTSLRNAVSVMMLYHVGLGALALS